MVGTRIFILIGFATWSFIPASSAACLSSEKAFAVMAMMGISAFWGSSIRMQQMCCHRKRLSLAVCLILEHRNAVTEIFLNIRNRIFDLRPVVLNSGKVGIADNGVHGGTDIMRHIKQGRSRRFQVFQSSLTSRRSHTRTASLYSRIRSPAIHSRSLFLRPSC